MPFWNRDKGPKFSLDNSDSQRANLGEFYDRWVELFNLRRSGQKLSQEEMIELAMLTAVADNGPEKADGMYGQTNFREQFLKYKAEKSKGKL